MAKKQLSKMQEILAFFHKEHGEEVVIAGNGAAKKMESISSGSIALDKALGVGGWPKGRIIEIFGPESSGKTTLATHIMANAHRADPEALCALIDAEHAFDMSYGAKLGCDIDRILFSQPDYGEQALQIAEAMVEKGIAVVVVDSVAALVPKAEIDGEIGDAHVGLQARLMSQALRKLAGIVRQSNGILCFINQTRQKIGGVAWGNNETTSGGNALKFYASVRAKINRIGSVNSGTGEDKEALGNKTLVKLVKNKVAPPFREARFDIVFGEGIDSIGELLDNGVEVGLIEKKSSGYYVIKGQTVQGREPAKKALAAQDDLLSEIYSKACTVPPTQGEIESDGSGTTDNSDV